MLSHDEQRQLAEIEQQFIASDPVLAGLLRNGPASIVLGAVTATFSLFFSGVVTLTAAACLRVASNRRAERG